MTQAPPGYWTSANVGCNASLVVTSRQSTSDLIRQTSVGSTTDDLGCNWCGKSIWRMMASTCCQQPSFCLKLCLLWACVSLIAIVVGCILPFVVFRTRTISSSPSDARIITLPAAALLCQAVILESPDDFRVAGFAHAPRVNPLPSSVTRNFFDDRRKVPGGGYVYWAFHMLDGTTVRVAACGPPGLYQYFVWGGENLRKMINGCRDMSCYVAVSYPNQCPRSSSVLYTIQENDDYYFFYTLDPRYPWESDVTVHFELNRTNFEYYKEDKSYGCYAYKRCRVQMRLDVNYALVYRASNAGSFNTVTVSCEMRLSMYGLILWTPLLLIGICLSVFIWYKSRGSEQAGNQQRSRPGHTGGLVRRHISRLSPGSAPPRYEDLVCDSPDIPPPPYSSDNYM